MTQDTQLFYVEGFRESEQQEDGKVGLKQVRFLQDLDDAIIIRAHIVNIGGEQDINECLAREKTMLCPFCARSLLKNSPVTPTFDIILTFVRDRENNKVKYFTGGGQIVKQLYTYEQKNGSITGIDFQLSKLSKGPWTITPVINSLRPLSYTERELVAKLATVDAIQDECVPYEEMFEWACKILRHI